MQRKTRQQVLQHVLRGRGENFRHHLQLRSSRVRAAVNKNALRVTGDLAGRAGPVRASTTGADFVPEHRSLPVLREAVQSCRGCDLYRHATQAVAGEGPRSSIIVFIGEQPGDEEDRQGRPFVGPAGRLLDRALAEAGIDRSAVYVTNAVKHFKFEERGKRRIHKKPSLAESKACRLGLRPSY
jgi:uracil-DNA glycosylase family protein